MRPDPLVTGLAVARRSRGWSQEHLAEVCGVTRVTISRLECGVRRPNLTTLRLLAGALGYDVELRSRSFKSDMLPETRPMTVVADGR